MIKFTALKSTCSIIRTENIDTDQIIPAQFLKTIVREGLGKYLFYNWRGKQFNNLIHGKEKILIAGNNFGCGSSREHAVWALMDYGFKVIISSSFADIFYNNSLKNGLLPIILHPQELNRLFKIIEKDESQKVKIDLTKQEIITGTLNQINFNFQINSFRKTCLLKGVDELGYILSFKGKIETYEKRHPNL